MFFPTQQLLTWYDAHRRVLPWRTLHHPYATWMSEVMLQQTTVQTVIPYFIRWMQKFPNIATLASASRDDVLYLWQGLGYYRRAHNLHEGAQYVMQHHNGQLPQSLHDLLRIPSIGPYSARAILSIAFNQKYLPIDGNIRRVAARIYARTESRLTLEKWIQLHEHLFLHYTTRFGDLAQALMDFGANICTSTQPKCPQCPIHAHCLAKQTPPYDPSHYPVPTVRIQKHRVEHAACIYNDNGQLLMLQRPYDHGLLSGTWTVPLTLFNDYHAQIHNLFQCTTWTASTRSVQHVFTHFRLKLHLWFNHRKNVSFSQFLAHATWVSLPHNEHFAFSTLMRKIIKEVMHTLNPK